MQKFASRLGEIEPFSVMELLEAAKKKEKEGIHIVHMEIGEPDFDTPKPIIAAGIDAMKNAKTHYTHSLGILELREAISNYKKRTRNIKIDPNSEIMITAGSSPAFFNVLGAILNPGDEVIVADPGYPCYQNFIRFFGAKVVSVPVYEEDSFSYRPEEVEKKITPKTKLIILNSPSNPTGQILNKNVLKELASIILAHNLWVISDEIYSELTYNNEIAPSISELNEFKELRMHTIIFDGFSKYWAMTGWRLGYIIAPQSLIRNMNKINQNFLICAPSIAQYAALAAFKQETLNQTKKMLNKYKLRRDYILKRIDEIEGLSINPPNGAFYAFVNISNISNNSNRFVWDLLEKARIAATPGVSFGQNGEGFVRFSYCTSIENIEEGMNRLENYIKNSNN